MRFYLKLFKVQSQRKLFSYPVCHCISAHKDVPPFVRSVNSAHANETRTNAHFACLQLRSALASLHIKINKVHVAFQPTMSNTTAVLHPPCSIRRGTMCVCVPLCRVPHEALQTHRHACVLNTNTPTRTSTMLPPIFRMHTRRFKREFARAHFCPSQRNDDNTRTACCVCVLMPTIMRRW